MRATFPPVPRDALVLWVVFKRPLDYPDGWVVRRNIVHRGGRIEIEAVGYGFGSLEAARAVIPPDKVKTAPDPADDPAILEVWV